MAFQSNDITQLSVPMKIDGHAMQCKFAQKLRTITQIDIVQSQKGPKTGDKLSPLGGSHNKSPFTLLNMEE